MRPHLVYLIAGARPNFMKIAPIVRAFAARASQLEYRIIHTGQHYDHDMSGVFFEELGIPEPHHHLNGGGGSQAEQTAKIMVAFEKLCLAHPADCAVVVGDVNSTLACAIVAKKLHIRVAHIEAGLRSGDMRMPEEINRIVTDSICDWFFCTEPAGMDNLRREGKKQDDVFFVGHVMIDNLLYQRSKLEGLEHFRLSSTPLKRTLGRYGVLTLHRPANVDDPVTLGRIAQGLRRVAEDIPLVFPVHPRTRARMESYGMDLGPRIVLTSPMSFMDFLNLWKDAALVLTDSGGLQEETTALGVPCLTLRCNTERPITISDGTNRLVGDDPETIAREARAALQGGIKGKCPELWDGRAAERIADHLIHLLGMVSPA